MRFFKNWRLLKLIFHGIITFTLMNFWLKNCLTHIPRWGCGCARRWTIRKGMPYIKLSTKSNASAVDIQFSATNSVKDCEIPLPVSGIHIGASFCYTPRWIHTHASASMDWKLYVRDWLIYFIFMNTNVSCSLFLFSGFLKKLPINILFSLVINLK